MCDIIVTKIYCSIKKGMGVMRKFLLFSVLCGLMVNPVLGANNCVLGAGQCKSNDDCITVDEVGSYFQCDPAACNSGFRGHGRRRRRIHAAEQRALTRAFAASGQIVWPDAKIFEKL